MTFAMRQPAEAGATVVEQFELTGEGFQRISQFVSDVCGIRLEEGKEGLVRSRLSKRLRALGLDNFDDYVSFVQSDRSRQELTRMVDEIATNKTSFFRENQHFEYLRDVVLPQMRDTQRPVRIWSAGCSSGEEPFTIAMLLAEQLPEFKRRDIRILATDISTKILARAREAVYTEAVVTDIPMPMLSRHFTCISPVPPRQYQVNDTLRRVVRFGRLNLMAAWPMKGPFDFIFCRNTMIYFDKPTRERLVRRFWELLRPGGHLFVGHSESLTGLRSDFNYIKPAVYAR